MAEFPALPLFTDAYIADTLGLSAEQHGLYLVMLMLCWRNPRLELPGDMKELKRMLGCVVGDLHGNRFNRIVPGLLDRFFIHTPDGNYTQKRLNRVRDHARFLSQKGQENAEKRWGKRTPVSNEINGKMENSAMLPTQSNPYTYNPHIPITTARDGVRGFHLHENGEVGGGWSRSMVEAGLSDDALQRAKQSAPGWDIYNLMGIYAEGINSNRRTVPKSLNAAFPAWCAKYTKGKRP